MTTSLSYMNITTYRHNLASPVRSLIEIRSLQKTRSTSNTIFNRSRYSFGYQLWPLLSDLSHYYYQTEFIKGFLLILGNELALPINFAFRDIDDALSLNNSKFDVCVDHIYHIEPVIKATKDTYRAIHWAHI